MPASSGDVCVDSGDSRRAVAGVAASGQESTVDSVQTALGKAACLSEDGVCEGLRAVAHRLLVGSTMECRRALVFLAALFLAFIVSGCHDPDGQSPQALAVQEILNSQPGAAADVWPDVQGFYAGRNAAPAWVRDDGAVAQVDDLLAALDTAGEHGLNAGDYNRDVLALKIREMKDHKSEGKPPAAAVANLDVAITSSLLTLGHDVALGRTRPSSIDRRWKARRLAPDFAGTLGMAADHLELWLNRIRPQHVEYAQLQQALQALQGQRGKGGWPRVPASALTPGRTSPAVVALRRRLAASGHLTGTAATSESPMYDQGVTAAVKAFQEHHTLKADGVADAATISTMNVPIEDRLRQVALNLERWRWMPDDFGSRHLIVNIPSYHVIARENGRNIMDIRVVVGKPGNETPVFSGEMTTVVFSPYWNIPDTIAEGETVPALARDRKYLDKNNIEVLRRSKTGVDLVNPKDVDWDDEESLKTLMFRQKPGPNNALGHVKFLFPNEYDVYLHDTPADALFARTGRAFSHGCVRVEEPETLAKYVLQGDDNWNEPKILEAMNAGIEKPVKLKESIPVHIVYFTATIDENGGLHLLNDVYGYDKKQRSIALR